MIKEDEDALPFGEAETSLLNNRGFDDWPEITVWPSQCHVELTVGADLEKLFCPSPVKLNETEKYVAKLLGISEFDFGVFLRDWVFIRNTDLKYELGPEGRPKHVNSLIRSYLQVSANKKRKVSLKLVRRIREERENVR